MQDQLTHSVPASAFSRVTHAITRATAPMSRHLAGHRWFPLYAVVHHRGRRSGRDYAVPVAIRASADAFTIALPWGPRTQWARNVVAAGGCTIRWRGRDHRASEPRLIGMSEAESAFSPLQRAVLRAAGAQTFIRLRRD